MRRYNSIRTEKINRKLLETLKKMSGSFQIIAVLLIRFDSLCPVRFLIASILLCLRTLFSLNQPFNKRLLKSYVRMGVYLVGKL